MAGLAAKPNAGAALFPATVERAIEVLRLSTREAPPIAELVRHPVSPLIILSTHHLQLRTHAMSQYATRV